MTPTATATPMPLTGAPSDPPATPQLLFKAARSRTAAALALGLAVGVLTSYGQTLLGGTVLAPLVNSVSAWLVVPFVVGMWMRTPVGAIAAGLAACALQVIGYDVTSELRGFASPLFWTLFWVTGATLGGPLLGLAGHAWRRTNPTPHTPHVAGRARSAATAILPAAFISEGIVSYAMRLHQYPEAALWIAIGAALGWALSRGRRADLQWLALTLPLGVLGQLALGAITSSPFAW